MQSVNQVAPNRAEAALRIQRAYTANIPHQSHTYPSSRLDFTGYGLETDDEGVGFET